MTIQQAILTGKQFKLMGDNEVIQYFVAGTGPFAHELSCDYFVTDGKFLSTSLDLYADELLSNEWELMND
jgi:hypothetical protein